MGEDADVTRDGAPTTRFHCLLPRQELAAFAVDPAGRVTMWGEAAQRLFGHCPEAALDSDVRVLLPGSDGAVTAALDSIAGGGSYSCLLTTECDDGGLHDVELHWQPMVGRDEDAKTPQDTTVMVSACRIATARAGDPDPGDSGAWEALALVNEASARIGSTLSLGRTAREIMDVAVPRLADAVATFVLERVIAEDVFSHWEADGSIVARRLSADLTDHDEWADALPVNEVRVHRPRTPYAQCVATGKPILFTRRDDARIVETFGHPWGGTPVAVELDHDAFLLMPLKARGALLGFIMFTRKPGSRAFSARDVALAGELAARAAVCLDNARLYGQERRLAVALQRSLRPVEPTVHPGLEIAHRYLPVGDTAGVGGDWYDVIPLADGRVGLVIGDAMGHGAAAAAAMAQLRIAVRALASLSLSPAETLQRLDEVAQALQVAPFATCLYVVCDPAAGTCAAACAGHLPPVLARADGTTQVLDLPAALPLGVGGAAFETTEFTVCPGSTIALYTDGLVESRRRDTDFGVAAVRSALTEADTCLETMCDDVITAVRQENAEDDSTLLLVRLRQPAPCAGAGVRGE